MSEPFLGEIRMVGFSFNPRGWAYCAGQQMPISQNNALFALLGTTYGGDGVNSFNLPDLRGRMPIGMGQGPGLPLIQQGQKAGAPLVQLTIAELPTHNHGATFTGTGGGGGTPVSVTVNIPIADTGATQQSPTGNILAQSQQPGRSPVPVSSYAAPSAATGTMTGVTTTVTGGGGGGITGGTVTVGNTGIGQPFSIMPPFIGINFVIALEGLFPSRN